MKKAYIIVAHKNPLQLGRLVKQLSDGKSEFFIHIDSKVDLGPFKPIADISNGLVHFLERFDAGWGRYGTIKPYINGLQTIQGRGNPFDRIILLSGQDYPIKSNAEIDEFFESSYKSVFLDYFPIPNYDRWPGGDRGGLYRIDKYYLGAKWYQLLASKSLNLIAGFVPQLKRKIPYGMKPYAGQTWWILDKYALNYMLNFLDKHPRYIRFHENTFVADEMFVHMIIGNSNDERLLKSVENNEKRFTIWNDVTDAHPKMLGIEDFEAIKHSDDLFARKFDDEADALILDKIDEEILSRQVGSDEFKYETIS